MAGDRFGQANDYSQTFAYLAQQNLNWLEDKAEDAEARRESEQAAKDQQVFDRYNAGKLTDEQLLDYIRRRIKETAYDPEQQADWRQALLQYTESINDSRALREFERSRDYAGYISYLRTKLGGMKGNSAKKAEIEQQIQQLIDQRDQGSVAKGADRILLDIQRGRATYEDLLEFYQNKLKVVSDPALKQQIRGQITDITGRIRDDGIQNQVAALGRQLANHSITPQQYGQRLKEIANASGYRESNAAQYNAWMDDATKAINTVTDTGRLADIDGRLQRGEITPQQAMNLYYREADRYKESDPGTYFQIRNLGWEIGHKPPDPIPGQTPLPNPGVLGLPNGTKGNIVQKGNVGNNIFRYITQLDGSEFGQVNCVYASASMLAYAMGYREKGGGFLSGGDLRYLSGDRGIGTNLDEAQAALAKLGIGDLRNFNDRHVSFEAFKKKVGQKGMPAVLMGVNNNLPQNLKAFSGAARGHGVFVAAYDPKKDAFLWYDPAVSKNQNPDYNGIWVDADVVKNFGWGPGYSDSTGSWSFSGQALFAPPGTIKGDWSADHVKRPPIHYVNVDDAPVRPETPKRYKGYNNRGPSTVEPAGNPVVDSKGRPRGAKNGRYFTDEGHLIDTVEEVQAELEKNGRRLEILNKLDEAQGKGKDRVTIGGQTYLLNDDLFKSLDKERLDIYDHDIMFGEAAGLDNVVTARTKDRVSFLAAAASRNSLDAAVVLNTAVRDAWKDFQRANDDPDPTAALRKAREISARLKVLSGTLQQGKQTDTPLDDLSQDEDNPGAVQNIDSLIRLMDLVTEPSDLGIADRLPEIIDLMNILGAEETDDNSIGNDLGNLVMGVLKQNDAQGKIDRGEAVSFIDGKTGQRGIAPLVPTLDPLTGEETVVPIVTDDDGNPARTIQVPVQTATGVEMQTVRIGQSDPIGLMLVSQVTDQSLGLVKGVPLTGAQLAGMDAAVLQQMVMAGQLQERPITVPQVTMPKQKKDGKLVPGQTFFQDQQTGNWWAGTAPLANLGERNNILSQYIGIGNDLQPEFGWRPYSSAGMYPTPFQGSRKAIQDAADAGTITLPQTLSRGQDGEVNPDPNFGPKFNSPYDPLSSADYIADIATNRANDEAERGERIMEQVKDLVDRFRQMRYDEIRNQDLQGADRTNPNTFDAPGDPFDSRVPGTEQDPSTTIGEMPWLHPSSRVMGPYLPFSNPTQPTSAVDNVSRIAKELGINLDRLGNGPLKGPQGPAGYKPKDPNQGPVGPADYKPPQPKKFTYKTGGRKHETELPRIGSRNVRVGSISFDVPTVNNHVQAKQQRYQPPPPNTNKSGGSKKMGTQTGVGATAAILGLTKKPSGGGGAGAGSKRYL